MFVFKHQKENKKPNRLWPLYLAAAIFIAADIIAASYLTFIELNKNKIYPGVRLGQMNLGGKTMDEARTIINAKINNVNQGGIEFSFDDHVATVTPIISSLSGDLAYEIVTFNADDTLNRALAVGRGRKFYQNALAQFRAWQEGAKIKTVFTSEDARLKKVLAENFGQFERPAKNAELYATTTSNSKKKEIALGIKEETPGFRLDYEKAIQKMKASLEDLNTSQIIISTVQGTPTIKKSECQNIETKAKIFLDKAELSLMFADKKWPIGKEIIANWLMLSRGANSEITFDLNPEKIKKYLEKEIAPQIEIAPTNARFQIKDNRVVEFATSSDGQKINYDQTFETLRADFLTANKNSVAIAMEKVSSEIKTEKVNNLGITEIFATGHSNFSGSPKNRIHNINTGAAALNGLLIAPGEEFSVNKALGDVTAETGYLPEMTIKGDKTVPEYGGGLCQIGTTVFRAALASGFPITARQSHSYRVGYYEPAGTDATIYGPWPDLRFINDSKNYILIQAKINGNDIYFDFWGTKDGRVAEQTTPIVSNIVKPAPTKLIETLALKPGEKKCTERAHNGADAYFDYKVTYADGTVKEKTFKSHYVPWREVCLIGVEKLSTTTPAAIPPK